MISIAAVIIALLAVAQLWRRQRPAFIAAFIVVFSFAYRVVDVGYLDLAGPEYAIELERHVGGNGAAPMFVVAWFCFLIPLAFIASRKRILAGVESPIEQSGYLDGIQRAALFACAAVVAFLYLDMLRLGTIPLLAGMDRLEYNVISGLLHNRAYGLNFLLSATLGLFTVLPRLRGGRFSLSFAAVFMLLLLYWVLTANRFSALFVTLSYYAFPFSALVAMHQKGILPLNTYRDAWSALVSMKVVVPLAILMASVTLVGLVINSYYSVRSYADPVYHITQRVLVQPVQTWATTWDRTTIDRPWNPEAIDYVIFNPPIAGGNPTVRYLMERELGYFRATELLDFGQQYAGGYPEIFFELFGFWLAFPLMLLLGCAAAFLVYLAIRSLCRGMVLTSFMAIYLYYGFSVAYLGGMLSFLLAPTYAMKLVALIVFFIAERYFLTRTRRNVPVPVPAIRLSRAMPRDPIGARR